MKKKILSLILTLAMVLPFVPAFEAPLLSTPVAAAEPTKTLDEAMAWLDTLVGTKVGTGQCVALIKAYYEYLGAPTPYGNGCDYATNAYPSDMGWERLQGATPQMGDILVWTEGYKNYGHVAICGDTDTNKFYHQNKIFFKKNFC